MTETHVGIMAPRGMMKAMMMAGATRTVMTVVGKAAGAAVGIRVGSRAGVVAAGVGNHCRVSSGRECAKFSYQGGPEMYHTFISIREISHLHVTNHACQTRCQECVNNTISLAGYTRLWILAGTSGASVN
jgi:hypothetical protein